MQVQSRRTAMDESLISSVIIAGPSYSEDLVQEDGAVVREFYGKINTRNSREDTHIPTANADTRNSLISDSTIKPQPV